MEKGKTPTNSYDEMKGLLNIMRKLNNSSKQLREQVQTNPLTNPSGDPNLQQQRPQQQQPQQPQQQPTGETENGNTVVINNVEVVINTTDQLNSTLKEDQKAKISQIIDSFRTEVSDLVQFGQLNLYDDSAKLDGQIGNLNIGFTLSAGDDEGAFLTNANMLKLTDEAIEIIMKLKKYGETFSATINDMLVNRQ